MPKLLAKDIPQASLIIKSLRGLLGVESLFPLPKKPSCRVKEPKIEGFSTTSLKSSSSLHRSFDGMKSKNVGVKDQKESISS